MSLKLEELIKKQKNCFLLELELVLILAYQTLEDRRGCGKLLPQFIFKILFLLKEKRIESWKEVWK